MTPLQFELKIQFHICRPLFIHSWVHGTPKRVLNEEYFFFEKKKLWSRMFFYLTIHNYSLSSLCYSTYVLAIQNIHYPKPHLKPTHSTVQQSLSKGSPTQQALSMAVVLSWAALEYFRAAQKKQWVFCKPLPGVWWWAPRFHKQGWRPIVGPRQCTLGWCTQARESALHFQKLLTSPCRHPARWGGGEAGWYSGLVIF